MRRLQFGQFLVQFGRSKAECDKETRFEAGDAIANGSTPITELNKQELELLLYFHAKRSGPGGKDGFATTVEERRFRQLRRISVIQGVVTGLVGVFVLVTAFVALATFMGWGAVQAIEVLTHPLEVQTVSPNQAP